MGQILNRIKNIAKAYKSAQNTDDSILAHEDEELKRIIDELNNNDNGNSSLKNEQTADSKQQYVETMTIDKAYRLLKINKNATDKEIKTEYKERIKEYHPDRLESFGEDLKELAKRRTQEINQAYSLIKKERNF